jgi:VIT1/CCC1 family predicted Fe2+/Mn2+ transporter
MTIDERKQSSLETDVATPAGYWEQHRKTNPLRDIILGGQDGLVNMLGIVLGVVAAQGSTHVLIVTGLAAAITESISMGAVAYTSFGSDQNFYLAARARSQDEIA